MADESAARTTASAAALACAVLADGQSRLVGLKVDGPVSVLIAALGELGVRIAPQNEAKVLVVAGCGGNIPESSGELDVGDDAAAIETLLGLLAVTHGSYTLAGGAAGDLDCVGDAVRDLGGLIGWEGEPGRLPLNLAAHGLRGGEFHVRPAGLTYLARLLPALPYAGDDVLVRLPGRVAAMGILPRVIEVMEAFGVTVLHESAALIVPAPQRYTGCDFTLTPAG